MFTKLSALIALLPLVNSLTIDAPTDVHSTGTVTLKWTTSAGDPDTFSVELVNADVFHNSFAIANNVDSSLQVMNVTLPVVPAGPGYTLQAVNVTNINQVFAESAPFTVEEAVSTTSSSASSTSAAPTTSGASSAALTTAGTSTTSAFGTIVSPSATSGSSAASNSGSGTASTDAPAPSTFNGNGNGAAAMGYGSWGAMALAAVAGAAVAI